MIMMKSVRDMKDIAEYEEEDYESDLAKELLAKGELKSCPFCGAKAMLVYCVHGVGSNWAVECTDTHAHRMEFSGTQDEVIREWNRRGGEPRRCCANCKHFKPVEYESCGRCDIDPGWQFGPMDDGCDGWEGDR